MSLFGVTRALSRRNCGALMIVQLTITFCSCKVWKKTKKKLEIKWHLYNEVYVNECRNSLTLISRPSTKGPSGRKGNELFDENFGHMRHLLSTIKHSFLCYFCGKIPKNELLFGRLNKTDHCIRRNSSEMDGNAIKCKKRSYTIYAAYFQRHQCRTMYYFVIRRHTRIFIDPIILKSFRTIWLNLTLKFKFDFIAQCIRYHRTKS